MHRRARLSRPWRAGPGALLAAAVVVGCGTDTVAVTPATDAGATQCERLLSRLPADLLGQARRDTTGRGTAAWGDPPVVLRCGETSPPPTTDRCIDVSGVDWVLDEETVQDGAGSYVSYGRSPAVEVMVPAGADAQVLAPLAEAVTASLPVLRECL